MVGHDDAIGKGLKRCLTGYLEMKHFLPGNDTPTYRETKHVSVGGYREMKHFLPGQACGFVDEFRHRTLS